MKRKPGLIKKFFSTLKKLFQKHKIELTLLFFGAFAAGSVVNGQNYSQISHGSIDLTSFLDEIKSPVHAGDRIPFAGFKNNQQLIVNWKVNDSQTDHIKILITTKQ